MFRQRLINGDPLIGTWVKTPSHVIADVLGLTDLDCICLDAEHAPFDRLSLDASIGSLRASNMPVLVRVPTSSPEQVLSVLDSGATGVVAPHVKTPGEAEALARASRYGAGGRGYAGSGRYAGYTTKAMSENLVTSREETTVIAQIEDIPAVDAVDEIAQVDGVDCLFIGRIDLTVAYGASSPSDEIVVNAVEKICAAGKKHNRRIGMYVSDMSEIPKWIERGTSLFILKSEHVFMLEGARALREAFDKFR